MRKTLSAIGICAVVITQGCGAGDLGEVADVGVGRAKSPPAPSSAPASGSSAEAKALRLAHADMVKRREDLTGQRATPCKLSSGLLIIYSKGHEYLIDKSGEEILYRRFLPQPPSKSVTVAAARAATISAGATRADDELDEDDARELTEEDARQAYGSTDDFKVKVCELPDTWRVIYEPKGDASGGGPHYNIDKRTREIVSKRYYQ
jgi:hypothetical protein